MNQDAPGRPRQKKVEEWEEEIATIAAGQALREHRLIHAIGQFDALGGWHAQGAVSCAHWLSWRIGLELGAAREKLRVAKALRNLVMIDGAFAAGQLSYSKVRALTRVATPENEAALVEMAVFATASQLEQICRRFRSVLRSEAPSSVTEAETQRFFSHSVTADGMMRFSIQLPAEEGARLLAAVATGQDATDDALVKTPDVSAETPGPSSRRNRADGLMIAVESFLEHGAKKRSGGAPNEVILHASRGVLRHGEDGAFIENGGPIAVRAPTAQRLSCDAGVVEMVEDVDGAVLSVGRRTRTVPSAIRRALQVRDQNTCTFPGCTHNRFLDAHHVQHWAHGGETKLDNLILLCARHHRFVHEHGFQIKSHEGRFHFYDSEGRPILESPPMPAPEEARVDILVGPHEQNFALKGGPLTAQGDGGPVDYVQIIDALVSATGVGDVRAIDGPKPCVRHAGGRCPSHHWPETSGGSAQELF